MPALDVAGEFETIERLLRPLAHPEWGRGLADDVAVLPSRPGYDLVLTKDAMVEGVHFLPDDPLDMVARKLLRVNLSDLAAKGAEPFGYLLACFWSERCGWPEREAFAAGLAEDQAKFGVHLLGGDTVRTSGPASFSLTAMGWATTGKTVSRAGAQVGDLVFVTGVIGDGLLGLRAARGELSLEAERIDALLQAMAPHCGMPPRRLVRCGDATTWLEIYEGIANWPAFEAALRARLAALRVADVVDGERHLECFVAAATVP